jgi:hypothetical protein
MDHKKYTERKMETALAELRFRRLGERLYGAKRLR